MRASALATIHPGIFTALTLGSLILTASGQVLSGGAAILAGLLGLGLWLGWTASVGAMSSAAAGRREAIPIVLLCIGALVAVAAKSLFYPPGARNTVWDILGLGLIIVLVWRSALAFETAPPVIGQPTAGRVAKTAALLLFCVVGAWVLRPRLLQIAATTRD